MSDEVKVENANIENEVETSSDVISRDKTKKKETIFDRLGKVSDKTISIIATIAMAIMIIEPTVMAGIDMVLRNVDYSVLYSWHIVRTYVFPTVSVLAFVLYILVLLRIRSENTGIVNAIKKNPVFIIFSLAVIYMFVAQMINGMESGVADVPDYVRGESFDMQYSYFIFILFSATQVRLEKHKRLLIRIQLIVSVVLVVAAFVLWHTMVESLLFYNWYDRFSSIFSNRNYYGYYLAVSVPLAASAFLHEKNIPWKIIAGLSFVVNTVGLSLNDCLGAWIGAAFAMLFIAVARFIIDKKINLQSIILIVVFIIALYIPGHITGSFEESVASLGSDITSITEDSEDADMAGSGRWRIWKATMEIIFENPWIGIGFEGVLVREYVGPPWSTRPHNEFMQYALFYGIPMVVLYVLGCFGIFIRALRKKMLLDGSTLTCLAAAFGYLVSSFFGLTVYATAMYLFVFLGMGYVRDETEIETKTDKKTEEVVA